MGADGSFRPELAATDESLRRLARHLTVRGADAEDLAQEVWLSALRKPGRLGQREWFRVVARRTLWRWSRRESDRSSREREVARPEAQDGDSSQVEAASLREYLSDSVGALKEPYREVVRLHYLEDLSLEEIGRRLGRPSVTVRVQLKRGLDQLRNRLQGRRGRFLGLAPLFSWWSSPRPAWLRRVGKRNVALGAIAAVFAVALLVIVPGRAERAHQTLAFPPDVASRPGSSFETSAERPFPGRAPLPIEELQSARASPPVRLSGRVLRSDGRPIAGAPVFLRDQHGASRVVAVSGAEGRYEVAAADLEDWIVAHPDGFLPTAPHLVCSVEQGRELDLVTARPGGELRGRVLDAQGRPVSGAEVLLRTPLVTSRVGSLLATTLRDELAGRASFGLQGTVQGALEPTRCLTDVSGRFVAARPPEEKFVVVVSAPGLPPGLELVEARAGGTDEDGTDEGGTGEELEIRLALPASLEGRVLDEGGRPCAGALLELSFPEPLPRQETRTDPSGRYRFDGLGSGPFVLRLLERANEGSASCHVEGQIAAGQSLPFDVELSAECSILGTLEEANGRSLEGWTVVLWEIAERDFPAKDSRQTRTGSGGRFAFLGCSDKEYDLEFFDPAASAERHRASTRASRTPLVLQPRPSELAAFHGRLVRRENAPQPSLLSVAAVRGSMTARQALVPIDAETGEFHGPSLPRGRYHVDAFFPGSAIAWRKTLELDERELVLEVPAQGSLRLEIELPEGATFADATAFVRVRAPLATYWIHAPLSPAPGQDAFLAELMPGTYWCIVLLEGYAAECVKAKIEEGSETLLSVTPKKGTAVTLQVVTPRALLDGEVLRLEVEETERSVPVPFFREAPGEGDTWWAGAELSADARRIVASTTAGLAGELALTPDLVRPGAILRLELSQPSSAPR